MAAAREKGVSVEAEIGHVVSGKVIVERGKGESMLTDPEEAGRFAQQAAIEPVLSRYFEISGSIGRGSA